MDDQMVSPWVGAMALAVMLAALGAVAWLLVSLSPSTSGGSDRVSVSERQVSRSLSPHHQLLAQRQRCIDAAAARGGPGCVAASVAPSAPPIPADRRAQGSTHPAAVVVTPPTTQVSAPTTPASLPPSTQQASTQQPSTQQPSTPSQPAPTRHPSPHNGPVPGGNTSPPHTGPRP